MLEACGRIGWWNQALSQLPQTKKHMGAYYSRLSPRTRARKRRERLIRSIFFVLGVAVLAVVGAYGWRQHSLDQEKRMSDSWRSVPGPSRDVSDSNEAIAPRNEELAIAEQSSPTPAASTPHPKNRPGVASVYFGERELVPLDREGRQVHDQ